MRRGFGTIIALALVLAACGSGPSLDALRRNQPPPTTTTTTAPPEGLAIVTIKNGKFTPAILEIKLEEQWIVRWVNEDPPREYTLVSTGLFESEVILPGESWEFDFSGTEPSLYRYYAFLGLQRIPGSVDTRPER